MILLHTDGISALVVLSPRAATAPFGRGGRDAGEGLSSSIWVSCLPQESTKGSSRLQCLSLQNNAVAWSKPQRQGEVLVCLLNSQGKEATAREMREGYKWEDLCCCAEKPGFFLMETPFFMETESFVLLIVQRVCVFARRSLEISCARRTHSPAVPPAFLLSQLMIPKLPVCHLGWPRASLPAQILDYIPISSTATALSHWRETWEPLKPQPDLGVWEVVPGKEQKVPGDRAGLCCHRLSTDSSPISWWPGIVLCGVPR